MKPYVRLDKKIGQTPLECMEAWRLKESPQYDGVPLAYAGRLDPMASGKLLVLIGEECKKQKDYHALDKEYEFEVLFGVRSDTGDVLGIVESGGAPQIGKADLRYVATNIQGRIELPYPAFSSKTVKGLPLHTWAVTNRLDEINIPTYTATIYKLQLLSLRYEPMDLICKTALQKIESIPPVTDPRKALGNDFRRPEVRASWKSFYLAKPPHPKQGLGSTLSLASGEKLPIARFKCICSSGLYMRTLSGEIAKRLGTNGLAYSIHRSKIGRYQKLPFNLGFWTKTF